MQTIHSVLFKMYWALFQGVRVLQKQLALFERYQKFDSKLSANKIVTKLLTFTVENYNNESISLFQLSIYFKILFSSGPDLGPDKTISFINFLSYNKIAH